MSNGRPAIREVIKRTVRQRCGFGCVICGCPVYDYEHMEGYANVKRHVANEITLLCCKHHREKTVGLLPAEDVKRANANPFNRSGAETPAYPLHFSGTAGQLIIGSNKFSRVRFDQGSEMIAVAIDRRPLLSFKRTDDRLLLSSQIFGPGDKRVLWIEDNELHYCPDAWDIRFEGRTFSIRAGAGAIIVEIEFRPPNAVEITRGQFNYDGLEVLVSPDFICYANTRQVMMNLEFRDFDAGIMIGKPLESGARCFHLPESNRHNVDRTKLATCLSQIRARR